MFICNAQAQYSAYYNINKQTSINANINHNINGLVLSHSTQTINTIDYGALALANAQREQNKIEQQKIIDEKQKKMFSDIIAEPVKAYDYGTWTGFKSNDKQLLDKTLIKQYQEITGLKGFGYNFVFPAHFFTGLSMLKWQNVSSNGVITEISFNLPIYNKNKIEVDYEATFEKDTLVIVVGKECSAIDNFGKPKKIFYHKKELNLATVFNAPGHKSTYIWEDKYENGITDGYVVYFNNPSFARNGIIAGVTVRYIGDKDDVSFEQLEGRRYYLKGLIDKIVSTARIQDLEFFKE